MSYPFSCPWCGFHHSQPLACPRVKRIEYGPDKVTIVAIEFHTPCDMLARSQPLEPVNPNQFQDIGPKP